MEKDQSEEIRETEADEQIQEEQGDSAEKKRRGKRDCPRREN